MQTLHAIRDAQEKLFLLHTLIHEKYNLLKMDPMVFGHLQIFNSI